MKKLSVIALVATLSACTAGLPQGKCGDGYVEYKDKCIKPGMKIGDGVIEAGIVLGAGVAAVNTGVVALP